MVSELLHYNFNPALKVEFILQLHLENREKYSFEQAQEVFVENCSKLPILMVLRRQLQNDFYFQSGLNLPCSTLSLSVETLH